MLEMSQQTDIQKRYTRMKALIKRLEIMMPEAFQDSFDYVIIAALKTESDDSPSYITSSISFEQSKEVFKAVLTGYKKGNYDFIKGMPFTVINKLTEPLEEVCSAVVVMARDTGKKHYPLYIYGSRKDIERVLIYAYKQSVA